MSDGASGDQKRSLNRIEALLCFVLGYLSHGWLGTFWFVAGFVTIFGWADWIGRYAEHRYRRRLDRRS